MIYLTTNKYELKEMQLEMIQQVREVCGKLILSLCASAISAPLREIIRNNHELFLRAAVPPCEKFGGNAIT